MDAKKILESLKKDLIFYNDSIKEVAKEILDNNISKYPVFIAHQFEVNLGETILSKDDYGTDWTINASIAEELTEKNVIDQAHLEKFISIYKDPSKFMCIFLISEKGGNFIFHPYK